MRANTFFFTLLALPVCSAVLMADSTLADAVQRGDADPVHLIPANRDAVNAAQPDGTTALHWAVRHNDAALVDALIKAGADVKAATRYGVTAMSLAATNGNAAIIRRLLDAGVDANAANAGGETALMTATRTGKLDAMKVLLDRGANVNAHDTARAQTALMWAVTENHPDAVKLLLDRGADIHMSTVVTVTPGEYVPARPAAASGTGIIRQRALPTPNGGMTPLLFAVRDGNAEMVKLLLDRGANVNAADDYHRGPLFAAIDLRNFNHDKYDDLPTDGREPLELIKTLIAKGANVNQQADTVPVHGLMQFDGSWVNFDGQTPFIRAALSGDIEVMRLLVAAGADPNIKTAQGTTSLMAAAGINWIPGQTYSHPESDYFEAVKLCLSHNAEVNAKNSLGLTAMHGAANRGWESVIQILADHGAQLDPKDNQGRTPMVYAQGIFLAIRPPEAKPKAMALLKQLMAKQQ
jgi:ankyrin repeat protein